MRPENEGKKDVMQSYSFFILQKNLQKKFACNEYFS